MKDRDEYRRAADALARRLRGDPGAAALAREIEALVRYELAQRLPEADRLAARMAAAASLPAGVRTAIISDIHGNHAGLLAVLDDIGRQRCDRIVCLGDLVDGGPENDRVVETLIERAIPCVRGNHDENNDVTLTERSRRYLAALPECLVEDDVLFVHISPRPVNRKINHEVEAWNVFEETSFRLVFIGHVHIPCIFGERCGTHGEAKRHDFDYGRPFDLAGDRYIVSVGSCAYGRDMVGKLRYAVYDSAANTVELRAVDGPLLPMDLTLR